MNTQHTPGPWVAKISESFTDCTIEARSPKLGNPIYIGRVYGDGGLTRFKNAAADKIANARLIAAAPELLEALKNAVRILTFAINNHQLSGQNKFDVAGHISAMRAAIAKAKGET